MRRYRSLFELQVIISGMEKLCRKRVLSMLKSRKQDVQAYDFKRKTVTVQVTVAGSYSHMTVTTSRTVAQTQRTVDSDIRYLQA